MRYVHKCLPIDNSFSLNGISWCCKGYLLDTKIKYFYSINKSFNVAKNVRDLHVGAKNLTLHIIML